MILMRRTDINMSPTIGDPSSMIVFSGQTNNVDTVFVDGRCLVRGGRPTHLNLDEIARAALASTIALSERDPARRQGRCGEMKPMCGHCSATPSLSCVQSGASCG